MPTTKKKYEMSLEDLGDKNFFREDRRGEGKKRDGWWGLHGGRLWLTVTSRYREGLVGVCVCVLFGRPVCVTKGPCRSHRMVPPAPTIRPFLEVIRRRMSGSTCLAAGVVVVEGYLAPGDDGQHHHKRPHGAVEVGELRRLLVREAALQFTVGGGYH